MFSLNKFFLIYRPRELLHQSHTLSSFVPNFLCSPSALLVSVRESEPERNLNPSANKSQNIKLIDAPGCVLLGKSKFWLILFYSHMTNYSLNISIWKFIIFYQTTSCLHTFSFPFMFSLIICYENPGYMLNFSFFIPLCPKGQ